MADPNVPAELSSSEGERYVEVPPELFSHLANDGIQGTIASWVPPISRVTVNGTYIIQGKAVADGEARAQMSIPDHEDCVEVTKAAILALLEEDALGSDQR